MDPQKKELTIKFMRKILFILILAVTSFAFAQHGGGRSRGYSQRQTDPTTVPKIGVVYGTVVDSATGTPIPYALSLIHI